MLGFIVFLHCSFLLWKLILIGTGNYMSMMFEMNVICSKLKLKVYKNWDDSNL